MSMSMIMSMSMSPESTPLPLLVGGADRESTVLDRARARSRRRFADMLLWRRPTASVLALLIGTALHQHCSGPAARPVVAVAADVLLVLACCCGVAGFLSRHLRLRPLIDVASLHLSGDEALEAAAAALHVLAMGGEVVRAAARGSDAGLVLKALSLLYCCAVLGKVVSTPTFLYLGLWVLFTVPWLLSKLRSSRDTSRQPRPRRREMLQGSMHEDAKP